MDQFFSVAIFFGLAFGFRSGFNLNFGSGFRSGFAFGSWLFMKNTFELHLNIAKRSFLKICTFLDPDCLWNIHLNCRSPKHCKKVFFNLYIFTALYLLLETELNLDPDLNPDPKLITDRIRIRIRIHNTANFDQIFTNKSSLCPSYIPKKLWPQKQIKKWRGIVCFATLTSFPSYNVSSNRFEWRVLEKLCMQLKLPKAK
jgi:hypothetical protein